MSKKTPIEKLDLAVQKYVREIGEDGDLSGWSMGYQLSRIVSIPGIHPVAHKSGYTAGLSTSPELAISLARLTQLRLERVIMSYDDEDEEEFLESLD